MLNRSAIAVTPKQPFLDWLNSVEADNTLTLDQLEKTLYLMPDYEDPEEAENLLKEGYEGIFNRELFAWHIGQKSWPKERSSISLPGRSWTRFTSRAWKSRLAVTATPAQAPRSKPSRSR